MNFLANLRAYELAQRAQGAPILPADHETDAESGNDETPLMYSRKAFRWEIELNPDGSLRAFTRLSSGNAQGKKIDTGLELLSPDVTRGSNIKARLLADNGEYVLGVGRAENDDKVPKRHEAFKALVAEAATSTGERAVQAVRAFLERHDPDAFRAHLPEDFDATHNIMISVGGQRPTDLAAVRAFWAARFTNGTEARQEVEGQCLITGEYGPVINREPVSIKGINGGRTHKKLSSANDPAYMSYGLHATQNAPMSFKAAEEYASGLNRLLGDPGSHLSIGDVTYVFWIDEGVVPAVKTLLAFPPTILGLRNAENEVASPQEVRDALWSVFTGTNPGLSPNTPFHVASLGHHDTRIVVRNYHSRTMEDLTRNLTAFFLNQHIRDVDTEDRASGREGYSVLTLAEGLHHKGGKSPKIEHEAHLLTQHALNGGPLPVDFLIRLAQRNRAERTVTRVRAALGRLVLLSLAKEDDPMTKQTLDALNPEHPDPAYHAGRLMYILEDVQRLAIDPRVNLTEKYYTPMSTRPYVIMPRLLAQSKAHLARLRREQPGTHIAKERTIDAVMSRLTNLPHRTLTPQEQTLFSLGYHHQRTHNISRAIEGKARKKAAAKSTAETLAPATDITSTISASLASSEAAPTKTPTRRRKTRQQGEDA